MLRFVPLVRHRLKVGLVGLRPTARFFSVTPSRSAAFDNIRTREEGERGTFEWRMFFERDSETISPWHEIPLVTPNSGPAEVSFVCEMPKNTDEKMEIATGEQFNPIKQDTKKGKLRTITYGLSKFNYGAIPQTWEDPDNLSGDTGLKGDDDPLDVVELGDRVLERGSVVKARVLCSLALIDEGETDWKIICIGLDDPMADKLHTVADVLTHKPGAIDTIRDWYRLYKTADGKPENEYAFDGEVIDQDGTMKIVDECHNAWKVLMDRLVKKM